MSGTIVDVRATRRHRVRLHRAPGLEETQVDRRRQQAIARLVRVQVVARVRIGSEARRIRRISHDGVEIDHGVERAALPNPPVHRLTRGFVRRDFRTVSP